MIDVVKGLYSCSYYIWNTLIQIAAVFFLIAIYKTLVGTPPEQQAQRFLLDALKYCMILYVGLKSWTIMGYIMDFCDGITSTISMSGTYTLTMGGDIEDIITETLELPNFELTGEWFSGLWNVIGCSLLFLIGGVVLLLIMVASCMSIISSAFQKILKPLMILPFVGIAVAMGAGDGDISRSLTNYMKTFFGFCISGALMIICIKIGMQLCNNLVSFNLAGSSNIYKVILITVQTAVTPIVISGLVKGTDSIVSRML